MSVSFIPVVGPDCKALMTKRLHSESFGLFILVVVVLFSILTLYALALLMVRIILSSFYNQNLFLRKVFCLIIFLDNYIPDLSQLNSYTLRKCFLKSESFQQSTIKQLRVGVQSADPFIRCVKLFEALVSVCGIPPQY